MLQGQAHGIQAAVQTIFPERIDLESIDDLLGRRHCLGGEVHSQGVPFRLGHALKERLSTAEASFEFCLQFQTDAEKMPIEDASVEWKEDDSPYVPVARIVIARQDINLAETVSRCEAVAFNPWFSLVEHQPLGNMNRARRRIYEAMAAFRQAHG